MRIRRSITRVFGMTILPAISAAVIAYFGYYALWGERGYVALHGAQTQLADARGELAGLTDQRERLEHRIALMKSGTPDPDLVEELARSKLMDGAPGQIAVPRDKP
ncbi:MAG: septum formation initiator family protein [Alphaproteobacteria bacterium]|nr:septum formation initiator family protein [Alphaproteobacteria bacterium]